MEKTETFEEEIKAILGQELADKQVTALKDKCGGDAKAAAELYRALVDDDAASNDEDSKEDIAYRDEFWDTERREWRVEKKTKKQQTLASSKIVVRQRFDEKMQPAETLVDVRCPKLASVMRGIYKDAEGVNVAGEKMTLEPDHFFWARDHLANARQYAVDHDDTSIVEVIDVALKFIEQYWPDNKIADGLRDGVVEFKDIWSIYPPNALIVGRRYLDDLRVYRVKSHHYYKTCKGEVFRRIKVEYYDFDGKVIGAAGDTLLIPEYTGALAITSLAFFPLNVSPNRDNIWDSLIARSKHQFDLFKKPFQVVEHEGSGAIQFRNAWEEWVEPQKFKFSGRIMVDPLHMTKTVPDMLIPKIAPMTGDKTSQVSRDSVTGKSFDIDRMMQDLKDVELSGKATASASGLRGVKSIMTESRDRGRANVGVLEMLEDMFDSARPSDHHAPRVTYEELSDDQRILFSGLAHGYGLADSKWGAFSVDNISAVEWNHGAFDSLVMDAELKQMVCSLVKSQNQAKLETDDFVRGKGKGLIGLLFGKPGLGKTLTAEAIAETAETPLFMISSGSLGHTADKISDNLTKLLDLGAHWRAVLLLDEADVFLNCRADNDLERNAIVSVFLRQLEYYQGILIMTTNRAETIDPAFQSRIHFCYQYPDLDKLARERIWKNFLDKTATDGILKVAVSEHDIAELAEIDHNGRQIKNVHSVAAKMAAVSEAKTLTKADIVKTVQVLQQFIPAKEVAWA